MNEKWRRECRLRIPKGLRPSAQGWRASGYPGCAFGTRNNANGVAVTNQTNRTTSTMLWPFVREWESPQPRCGWDVCWTMTQGSALRATLGLWDGIPLGFLASRV